MEDPDYVQPITSIKHLSAFLRVLAPQPGGGGTCNIESRGALQELDLHILLQIYANRDMTLRMTPHVLTSWQ